jgi:hypothetical protein
VVFREIFEFRARISHILKQYKRHRAIFFRQRYGKEASKLRALAFKCSSLRGIPRARGCSGQRICPDFF